MPCNAEYSQGITSATCISQRLISEWVIKQSWRDQQFQLLFVASHYNSAQHNGGPSSNSSSFEEYLHVLVPSKRYSKKSQTSMNEESNQIPSDTSLPSFISPDIFVPAETCTFSEEDTNFPLDSANESAFGKELGSVNIYFVMGGKHRNRGNMQEMVQTSVYPAIYVISLCALVMIVEALSSRILHGVTVYIGRTFPHLKFTAS